MKKILSLVCLLSLAGAAMANPNAPRGAGNASGAGLENRNKAPGERRADPNLRGKVKKMSEEHAKKMNQRRAERIEKKKKERKQKRLEKSKADSGARKKNQKPMKVLPLRQRPN